MNKDQDDIRRIREEHYKGSVKPVIQEPVILTAIEKPRNIVPLFVYDDAMKERELLHNMCTYIIDISIKEPFNPKGTSITIDSFQMYLYREMQENVYKGINEVRYLCLSYDRLVDKCRELESTSSASIKNLLASCKQQIQGLVFNSITNYFKPGMTQQFITQFFSLFNSMDPRSLIDSFIKMDQSSGKLDDHLFIIFSHLRDQVVTALSNVSLPSYNNCLNQLNILLLSPIACEVLIEKQQFLRHQDNSGKLFRHWQSDYLIPFFDFHPADFRSGMHFVSPDISSTSSINLMRSQYISLIDSMSETNSIQTEILKSLLRTPKSRMIIREWINTICEQAEEFLKTNPNFNISIPMGCILNIEVCLFNLAKPIMDKKKFPDSSYVFSNDPLILTENRMKHDIEKDSCSTNHETAPFTIRCLWMLFTAFYRSIKPLLNIREKALRNLSRICPHGYNNISDINTNNINEAHVYISIELQTSTYFVNTTNMNRWLYTASFISELLMSLSETICNDSKVFLYLPYSLIESIISLLSVYDEMHFPSSTFLSIYTKPIIQCLVACLEYDTSSMGLFCNVHTKADISKCIQCVYLPEQVHSDRILGQTNQNASDDLLSDTPLVDSLLHSLIRLFSEVQSIGLESSQYRKYIMTIIRFMWHDPRCQNIVVEMKNQTEIVQRFAQALIASFSKLTDDAFITLPQIRELIQEMLQPEFNQLEEKEQDEKHLHLTQMERSVRYNFDLSYETLLLLLDAARPWGEIWMNSIILKPLAVSLPRLVKQLVGSEGKTLKMDNPEKYNFNPNELLSLLVRVILVFSENDQFILCMSEEMTLEIPIFVRAQTICRNRVLLSTEEQFRMDTFVQKMQDQSVNMQSREDIFTQAPDEFMDELTGELMYDPVMLPNSRTVLDRSSIERHLLSSSLDPYDRTPLTKDQLIPQNDLKEKIRNWAKENHYFMHS